MRVLILFVLLLMVVFPSAAQRGKSEVQETQLLTIEDVVVNSDEGLTLSITVVQNDGCDFPLLVEQRHGETGNVLLIDVKRDIAALTNKECVSEPVTTELEVQIEGDLVELLLTETDADRLYLVVNDVYFYAPIERAVTSELQTVVREDLGINAASIEQGENEGEFFLVVEGMWNSTCLSPEIIRQTVDGNTLNVEIFKLVPRMPSTRECPQTLVAPTYSGRIPVQMGSSDTETITPTGSFVIDVNGNQFTYDFDTATQGEMVVEGTPVDVVIESAEVLILESFPPQLSLQIVGYHPDSCEFPVIVEQTVEENTITVHIYRELPPNVRCASAIVPYEENLNLGSFDPGTYTIDVNGTILEVEL
jgi:hypothetical protein